MDAIWIEQFGFTAFGSEHIGIVLIWLMLTTLLIVWGRRSGPVVKMRIGRSIGWTVFIFEAIWLLHKLLNGTFLIKENLPLDLCNVCALGIPMVMSNRPQFLFQMAYYWILTGTLQGVITPDLDWVFPYIGYLKYWFVHAGLITAVLYATFVYNNQPTFKGALLAFGSLQIWAALVYVSNVLLDANYGFLMRKPAHASLFDYFGTHYILVTQGVCFLLFLFWGCPFWLKNRGLKR